MTYQGVTRTIEPAFIFFGRAPRSTDEPEWFLAAYDADADAGTADTTHASRRAYVRRELKLFAMRGVSSWAPLRLPGHDAVDR